MNTLRGTQTLNSLISLQNLSSQKSQNPPVNSSKIQKEKGKEKEAKVVGKEKEKKSQKKINVIDQSETCENDLIAAAIAEKNEIRNNVYSGITINLDFTKNGQYPLVEFKM